MAELTTREQDLPGIKQLLWGTSLKPDIFARWSQGFTFSESEKSALEQLEGGPCSVIAPVQAFILKFLLLEYGNLRFRDAVNEELQNKILVIAACDILSQCNDSRYYVVHFNTDLENNLHLDAPYDRKYFHSIKDTFHNILQISDFSSIGEVEHFYSHNIHILKGLYGILLFLYSVIMTKGLEQVKQESDSTEPLIEQTYGYGSQSLINLMITGRGISHVFDNEQDVGGLKLSGLDKQSQIGFITLMEHLQLCTVGTFYKNPVHPIWILGSETHLTVLFSDDRKLVSPETKSEQARRVFKKYDRDGNNFISTDVLRAVLKELDLVHEEEYVDIMKKKLDSENLGIILLNEFMEEFFQKEECSTPDMFTLVHYNGLPQSNINSQIQYHVGSAILLESDLKSVCASNHMLTCLQTKWPNIEVNWCNNISPSLN